MRTLVYKLTILAVALVALAGCGDNAETRLRKMVEESAAQCPIRIDDSMKIDTITYNNNIVVYHVDTGDALPLRRLRDNIGIVDKAIYEAVKADTTSSVRQQIDGCRKAGASLKFILADNQGDTLSITVNPKDF